MLRCAFLSDAISPHALLWGDAEDMEFLAQDLRAQALCPSGAPTTLAHGPVDLEVKLASPAEGMSHSGSRLSWVIEPTDACRFADQLEALAQHQHEAHQFLDPASAGGVEVKVSMGEYPPDFRP
jgi:hypothetical protein